MQNLHKTSLWIVAQTHRGGRTLVQGRLKVRTGETRTPAGEKRGHLREGLRERGSEMFAGCLKEDGIAELKVD